MMEKPYDFQKKETPSFIQFTYDPLDINSLSNKMVIALAEGKDGSIWVATDGGLNRIDPNTLQIKRYLTQNLF
jgi:ligand-binding sensor domain-containing protein